MRNVYRLTIIFLLLSQATVNAQSRVMDSLRMVVKQSKSDTARLSARLLLSRKYYENDNLEQTLKLASQSKSQAQHLKSVQNLERFARLKEADANNLLGAVAWSKGDFSDAMEFHFSALRTQEQLGDKKGQGRSLNGIGLIHYANKDYKGAIRFLTRAIKYRQLAGDMQGLSWSNNNLGLVYYGLKQYRKALEYYFRALSINESLGNSKDMGTNCNNIGEAYQQLGEEKKALSYCYRGLELRKDHDDQSGVAYSLNNIAFLHLLQNHPQLAKETAQESIKISSKTGEKPALLESYQALSKADSMLGNYKEAYRNFYRYTAINDSLFNSQSGKQIKELQLKYDTQKKDSKIRVLELEQQSDKRNRKFLVGTAILLMLLLAAGIVSYRSRVRYTSYIESEEKRKELLLREVHHRTNNSLQLISALLVMQSDQVEDEKARGYLLESEARIHAMSALHGLLNQHSAELTVRIDEYLGQVASFHDHLSDKQVDITTDFPEVYFSANHALPMALMVNELITNSLKYAFADDQEEKEIRVSLTSIEGYEWELKIADNGRGLPEGTYVSKTGSIGSTIIRVLSDQLNATLETASANGAEICIRFSGGLSHTAVIDSIYDDDEA